MEFTNFGKRTCTGGTTNRQLDLEAPGGGMREQQTQYNT